MAEKIWRNEIKYICSQAELVHIEHSIRNICRLDFHTGENDKYVVRSLYFDDYHDNCLRENEDGADPRKKFRIRIYDGNKDRIMLECKHKRRGMTHKDSCEITEKECNDLIYGIHLPIYSEQDILLQRFNAETACKMLLPKVIVQYERTAYVYPVGNVRITFDRNISMSGRITEFLYPSLRMCPVMPEGYHILEVKYDELLPNFIYNALQVSDLRQTSFSKYYISRKMLMRF